MENKFWYIDRKQTDFLSLRNKNIRKRIYIKRFNEFAFMIVNFNLKNSIVFLID